MVEGRRGERQPPLVVRGESEAPRRERSTSGVARGPARCVPLQYSLRWGGRRAGKDEGAEPELRAPPAKQRGSVSPRRPADESAAACLGWRLVELTRHGAKGFCTNEKNRRSVARAWVEPKSKTPRQGRGAEASVQTTSAGANSGAPSLASRGALVIAGDTSCTAERKCPAQMLKS